MTLLREALDTIRDGSNWCRNSAALDGDGISVRPYESQAKRWCASGAVQKAFYARFPKMKDLGLVCEEWVTLNETARALFPQFSDAEAAIVMVNDLMGHDAVIQCFEKAIVETEGSL